MKKLYFLLTLCFGFVANSQIVNFPDANFKAKLLTSSATNYVAKNLSGSYFKIDSNNNGEIETSEALEVSYLDVSNSNISSLEAVNNFSNLEHISCSTNSISNLNLQDLLSLKYILCSYNSLTTLDVSNMNSLLYIDCSYNQITNMVFNNNGNIYYLSCTTNNLATLDVTELSGLQQLYASNNVLQSINLTGLNNLYLLVCGNNLLSSLDLTGLNILYLTCIANQLTSLDLSTLNLSSLSCSFNQLTSLDLGHMTNLGNLYCNDNQLTELNLNGCLHMQTLNCSNNQITTLNLNSMVPPSGCIEGCPASLNVSNNNLLSFFVKSGRSDLNIDFHGNPNIEFICTRDDLLTPLQNKANQYGYTNCNINSYCSFTPGGVYYTVQGSTKYDLDQNGCDQSDIAFPNMKLNISSGVMSGTSIVNSSGNFSIFLSNGNHTITPIVENPTYFTISPTSSSVIFPNTASPFAQDFCVTPNGTHNDLEITILPLNMARPGFDVTYKLIYKNKGTHSQSGNLSLSFDDSVIDFVTASSIPVTQTVNNLTWSFSNLQPFENREILLVMNLNSPTDIPPLNGGSVLNFSTLITGLTDETPIDNTVILDQIVVNSFDPNDKTCLEGATITPDKVGEYVHYLIRFENTGTANAQNVVVKDIIDTAKYDIASLIPINGSHEFYTRITNTNQVEFIFENINLPFNDANNDGYVAFKIRTKSTLVVGNTFANNARIYFDYNFPIVTNTATTTIQALGNSDFVFNDYFTLSPVPTNDVLHFDTNQRIEVSSISIYNTLGQLILVETNPSNQINVSNLKTGNYFIKVILDKGTSVGKFIKQ